MVRKCAQHDCDKPAWRLDPEVPPGVFVEDPWLCRECYAKIMRQRDENEASWNRMMRGSR